MSCTLLNQNKRLYQSLVNKSRQPCLGVLFGSERLEKLAQLSSPGAQKVFHTFGTIMNFYVDESEVSDDLFRLFVRTGAQTDTWKVFKLAVFELSRDELKIMKKLPSSVSRSDALWIVTSYLRRL